MMNIDTRNKTRYWRGLVLVGLALGAFGGAIYAHRALNRNSRYLSQLLAVSEYEKIALLQYKHADIDHGRQSMRDLLSFMDHVEASNLVVDEDVFEFDRSLAYMRLALLDEKSGDIEASRRHIEAAADCAKRLRSTDSSEAHLREVTGKLDSYLP